MGRVLSLGRERQAGGQIDTRRRPCEVNALGQLAGMFLGCQLRRDVDKIGIAQKAGPIVSSARRMASITDV